MKQLKEFINEKLHIGNFKQDKKKEYKPKTKNELKDNIIEVCKECTDDEIVNLNCIDTSEINDMSFLFTHQYIKQALGDRNIDISKWNVSKVHSFYNMFDYYGFSTKSSDKFNFDLSAWDVSKGYDFSNMFSGLRFFEGKGLDKWNMESARRIGHMFQGCTNLNCDLSSWELKDLEKNEYNYVFDETNLPQEKRPKYNNRYIK